MRYTERYSKFWKKNYIKVNELEYIFLLNKDYIKNKVAFAYIGSYK